jgi:hypothetical protein
MGRATAGAAALPASENREKEQALGGIGGDPVLRMVESRVRALERNPLSNGRKQWEGEGGAVDSESTARVSSMPWLVTLVALSRAAFSRRARRGSRSRVLPDPHRTRIALTTSPASSGEMTPVAMAWTVAASEATASPASSPTARSSTARRRRAGGRRRTRQKRKRPGSPLSSACSTTARVSLAGLPPSNASTASVALLRAPRGRPAGLPDWPVRKRL